MNTDGRWSVHELTLDNNANSRGQLPQPEIGEFHAVKAIDLSNNQLTGAIPPELGNLYSAPVLIDFSDNQLTGTIPPELGNLGYLAYLELENNQLTGELPSELTQLGILHKLYFQNNAGLCAPADTAFQTWLQSVVNVQGPTCDDAPPPPPLSPAPSECSEHITNFRTYNRTLTNDCASNDRTEFGNHYARQFTFTLSHPTVVEVLLRSQDIDTHIFL